MMYLEDITGLSRWHCVYIVAKVATDDTTD